jgi:hypothetical protein
MREAVLPSALPSAGVAQNGIKVSHKRSRLINHYRDSDWIACEYDWEHYYQEWSFSSTRDSSMLAITKQLMTLAICSKLADVRETKETQCQLKRGPTWELYTRKMPR